MLDEPKLEYIFHVTNPKVARLYALPKIHKAGNKMRPIASNISTPTEKMAKWLLDELSNIPPIKGCSIRNSIELVDLVKDVKLDEGELMVSFDVTALFPSIPIKLTLKIFEEYLLAHQIPTPKVKSYTTIAAICMEQNYVQFRGKFYKQTSGTSMGSKLAPYLSNIFMSHFENELKQNYPGFPKIWYRYVDDIFAVLKQAELQTFFNHINNIQPSIKFTLEKEENNTLNFLDLKIMRTEHNNLKFGIFRKETNTNKFITKESFHHINHKQAAFHSMAHRLFNIPMNKREFNKEHNYIINTALANGYSRQFAANIINQHEKKYHRRSMTTLIPAKEKTKNRLSIPYYPAVTNKLQKIFQKHNIELVTRPTTTIKKQLTNIKDKEPSSSRSGIYQIHCNNCSDTYIGQTSREFSTRLKEHQKARPAMSSVAEHMISNNHTIDTNKSKIIKTINQVWKLDAAESYYITNTPNLMNLGEAKIVSQYVLSCKKYL